jgi:signal transduction histidine kinase
MDMGQEPRRETIHLSDLLVKVADEFQPHAQAKGQSLALEGTADGCKVRGDALQLLQALRNVLGNAIKYTPDNGSIHLSLERADGMAKIEVRDTGYGIPAGDLPYIFNRFFRVRNNGHEKVEGNGLGLAIVKSIIEQHGGQVTVESEPGSGSCFTLTLPLLTEGRSVLAEVNSTLESDRTA